MVAVNAMDYDPARSNICQSLEGSACAHGVTIGNFHSHATIIISKLDRQSYAKDSFSKTISSHGCSSFDLIKLDPWLSDVV